MAKKKVDITPEQEETVKTSGDNIINTVWKLFSSMKLGITLLIILAIMTIIGTFLSSQQAPTGEFFNAWYYKIFLVLLLLNLFICSVNRLKHIISTLKGPKAQVSEATIKNLKDKDTITIKDSIESVSDKVKEILKSHRYRVFKVEEEGKVFFGADRGSFGILGPYITHISFIIIIIALWINYSPSFGYKGYLTGRVGSTVNTVQDINVDKGVMNADFNIKIRDFKVLFRPSDGSLQSYQSDVTVIENGKNVLDQRIYMNHPLVYKGYTFYQSGYFYDLTGSVQGQQQFQSKPFDTSGGMPQTQYEVPNTNLILVARVNTDNRVEYAVFKTGQQEPLKHDFVDFNKPITYDNINFQFNSYTGLSVANDPSKYIGLAGSLLMIAGVLISFLIRNRKIWAIVSTKNNGAVVEIGGLSQKNKSSFEKEFQNISGAIKMNRGERDGSK